MVVGFNHNFTYKGTVYHIQTEDSGRKSPRVGARVRSRMDKAMAAARIPPDENPSPSEPLMALTRG